jgi:hypothetical protein
MGPCIHPTFFRVNRSHLNSMFLQVLSGGLVAVSGTMGAQEVAVPSPIQRFTREAPLFVYDSSRDRLLLYGGAMANAAFNGDRNDVDHQTYAWDGNRWAVIATRGPRSRDEMAFGVDPATGTVIAVGGRGIQYDSAGKWKRTALRETWRFDGSRWVLVDTTGPEPRAAPQGAFDISRGRLVVFGGRVNDDAPDVPLTATWEWDGKAWQRFDVPGPMPRSGHQMAYDAHRKLVILHGGNANGVALTDTWAWNGKEWRLLSMEGPRSVFGAATTAIDSGVVMFGGNTKGGMSTTTWQWMGKEWRAIATGGPPPRIFNALATDLQRRRIYLIAGLRPGRAIDASGLMDLWMLDSLGNWSLVNSR